VARRALAITAGAAVVVLIAAAGLYLWLGTYAPLRALDSGFSPGPGIGADVQPVSGSGGRPVYFPAEHRRSFDMTFTLRNSGRFAVTVTALERPKPAAPPWLGPTTLLPFTRLRMDPGDTATVTVRFALRCRGATRASPDVFTDAVRLRYRYLSLFTRTQTVRLPFAVTLRCVGGPPATP
jgi:hypothetical protein